jgi:aspartate/methionine/tyrosine aminotransferase
VVSKRTTEMTSFIVMDVLEKACEMECRGIDIVHLEVGEPDFDTPDCVKEACCKAMHEGFTHYTHSLGMLELREAISQYYLDQYQGFTVDPDQIIVSSGSSPAIFMLFAALLEPDDEVIISDPHYACYPNFINFVQGRTVTVPVLEAKTASSTDRKPLEEKLTPRTKAIFINSPSNPTGNLLSPERMQAIAQAWDPTWCPTRSTTAWSMTAREHSILEYTDHGFRHQRISPSSLL